MHDLVPGEPQDPPAQLGEGVVAVLVPPGVGVPPCAVDLDDEACGLEAEVHPEHRRRPQDRLRGEAVEPGEQHADPLHRLEHRPALGVAALDDAAGASGVPTAGQPGDRLLQLVDGDVTGPQGAVGHDDGLEHRQPQGAVEDGVRGAGDPQRRQAVQRHEVLGPQAPHLLDAHAEGRAVVPVRDDHLDGPPRLDEQTPSAQHGGRPSRSHGAGPQLEQRRPDDRDDGRVDAGVGDQEPGERRQWSLRVHPAADPHQPPVCDGPGDGAAVDAGVQQLLPAQHPLTVCSCAQHLDHVHAATMGCRAPSGTRSRSACGRAVRAVDRPFHRPPRGADRVTPACGCRSRPEVDGGTAAAG